MPRIRIVIQPYPPKNTFGPPHGGLGGGAEAPIIRTPISHFIGGLESVEILGV